MLGMAARATPPDRGASAPSLRLLALLLCLASPPRVGSQSVGTDVESVLSARLRQTVLTHPCTRLLRADGDAGCSTGPDGVTGALYLAADQSAISAFMALPADSP